MIFGRIIFFFTVWIELNLLLTENKNNLSSRDDSRILPKQTRSVLRSAKLKPSRIDQPKHAHSLGTAVNYADWCVTWSELMGTFRGQVIFAKSLIRMLYKKKRYRLTTDGFLEQYNVKRLSPHPEKSKSEIFFEWEPARRVSHFCNYLG